MLVSSFVLLAAGAVGVAGSALDRRAQTQAVCGSSFAWTFNSANVSPCQLAAVVSSACAGSTWNVQALPDVHHSYNAPNRTSNTVNTCQCSWVAYNLFGACTVCQGYDAAVIKWGAWSFDCGDKIPPTPFPEIPLDDGTLIPYYATVDPKTWTDQRFNAAQAQPIVREGHSDVSQTNATEKKKTPVGPIVGGVIGGLAALGIAGAIAFWIHNQKKKRTSKPPTAPSTTSDGMTTLGYGSPSGHMRQLSDMSGKSIGTGYQNMGNSFVTSVTNTRGPASPTSMHTHTGSVSSLSYFGSVNNSVAPYATTASPAPVTLASTPSPPPAAHAERENMITPFTLSPSQRATSPNYPQDRKRADGAIIQVYDSPDSRPNEVGGRQRVNPPAYTDYTADRPLDSASQAPSRPAHTKKGSGDTMTTLASPISPSSPDSPVTHGTGVNTHISGIDDLLEQMNMGAPTTSGTGGTLATGLSMQVNRSQGPFRPTNPASEPEI